MRYSSLAGRLRRSVAFGVLASVASFPAFSQETTQPATVDTTQPAQVEENSGSDRVVITGSRLRTDSFTSASPMSVITTDSAQVEGIADVASMLQSATIAAGSSQVTAATSLQFVTNGGTGTETLSLRGLGATRTLILLDGRRAGPAGTRGSVGPFDLNVIPLSAIERVEILKDGASSLYGSDAIAGVVNIITKKGSGIDTDLFYSGPLDGGGEELRISGSWGEDYGNLRFRLTADYHKKQDLARGDRDFFSCGTNYVFNPDGTRADLVDPRTGEIQCAADLAWGHNWVYDYNSPTLFSGPWQASQNLVQFDRGGNLGNYLPAPIPFESGLIAPPGWYPIGYEELLRPGAPFDPYYTPSARNSRAVTDLKHPFQDQASVYPETERMTIMGSGEWDINDGMTAYAEVLLNRRMNKVNGYRQFWTYQYIYGYGDGYVYGDPMAIAAGWDIVQDGEFHIIGLSPLSITDRNDETVSIDYMRFVAGLKGDVINLPGWSWEISTQFSRSDGDYKQDVIWEDAVGDQNFRSSLCAGTTTRYRGAPCVDVNWYDPDFLAGNMPANYIPYLFGTVKGNTVYEQITTEAYITGDLIDLPAGPLGIVLGGLYQDDRINDTPAQAMQDGELWGDSQAGITTGNDDTRAVFAELGIPLVRDLPFIQSLDLSLSTRYTDVASYGGQDTWKVGLNWAVTPEFRVRGSQGTSFRTPSLFELYLAGETSFPRQAAIDPCVNWGNNLALNNITQRIADNCAADGIGPTALGGGGGSATQFASGGYGRLRAETSESRNLGIVWSPEFIDLQVSVDYFDITVNDEVSRLGAANILFGCYNSLNFPADELCDLFTRRPNLTVNTVQNDYINIASQGNRGIDIEAIYRHDLVDLGLVGDLTVTLQASHQLEDTFTLLPNSPAEDFNGEAGDPKWVGNLGFNWENGPLSVFWGTRYVDSTSNLAQYVEDNGTNWTFLFQPAVFKLSTKPYFYHNVSVAYDFPWDLKARVGISNLFDEEPPVVSSNAGYARLGDAVIESQYELLGRTAFVNITKSF
jgi:iron complex outermembrane receptor protein